MPRRRTLCVWCCAPSNQLGALLDLQAFLPCRTWRCSDLNWPCVSYGSRQSPTVRETSSEVCTQFSHTCAGTLRVHVSMQPRSRNTKSEKWGEVELRSCWSCILGFPEANQWQFLTSSLGDKYKTFHPEVMTFTERVSRFPLFRKNWVNKSIKNKKNFILDFNSRQIANHDN